MFLLKLRPILYIRRQKKDIELINTNEIKLEKKSPPFMQALYQGYE